MRRATLLPLVPRLTVEWAAREPATRWRLRNGSMAFADISGFSRLSEQLAERGPAGTEELSELINGSFESIVDAATDHGGDVLKIMGDAVLVWYEGDGHEIRAAASCAAMHASLARPLFTSTGRPVRLRMSAGAHTGTFMFAMTAGTHRELVVCGDSASVVMRCEKIANAGQTLVSHDLAARLPARCLGPHRGIGRLLRRIDVEVPAPPSAVPRPRLPDLAPYVPASHQELIAIGRPGEHRQGGISFLSIAGVDAVLADEGPDAVVEMVCRVTDAVDRATERWETQFLSSDNAADAVGLMITAGVPSSVGHDEERLLRTVRQVVDECPELDLRAGVNRGRIYTDFIGSTVRRGFTTIGDAVNLSARLMQGAARREIVASRAVLDWSDTRFEERPLPPFRVKNRVSLVEASVVGEIGERKERGAAHDLPFTGREREMAVLEAAADAAVAGAGSVLVVCGEPGIGKSRLVVELQKRRADLPVLRLAADEYTATVPYSLVRDLLAHLGEFDPEAEPAAVGESLRRWVARVATDELQWLPLLATALGAVTAPTRAVDDLAEEFRSARLRASAAAVIDRAIASPTLVVVEDAQWIDEASAELLAVAVRNVADRPRLVCLLVSGSDLPAWASAAPTVQVGALDADESRRLAAAVGTGQLGARQIDTLAERAGGNPLFLSNLIEAVETSGASDALPSTIESVITQRVDNLEPRDRLLLREAAVAGMDIDLPLLGRVLGQQRVGRADVWRRLQPFLARAGPGHLRFEHGLYQRVAYDGLSFRRRREIHLALGEQLELTGAEPAVLSLHFWRAEAHERAFHWSSVAAAAAHRSYANVEAAELYRRALTSADRAGAAASERINLAESLGDVLELTADYEGAAVAYRDARVAATHAPPIALARLHRKHGVLRERAGAYADALRWYGRAIRLLERSDDRSELTELAELELAYAGVRYRQGRVGDARQLVERAIGRAAVLDERVLGHAYYLLTVIELAFGDTAAASGRIALGYLEQTGDLVQQANLFNNLGMAAYFAGDWDSALADYGRSRDLGRRAGDMVLEATVANNIGEILSDRGELDLAIEQFEAAFDAFESAKYPIGVGIVLGNLGRARLRQGDPTAARQLLDEARTLLESINAGALLGETIVRLAECSLATGHAEEALALAGEAEHRLHSSPDPFVTIGQHRARAEALLALGRYHDAHVAADEAVSLASAAGATFDEARALSVRAAVRRAIAEGADQDARRSRDLLAALGARPPVSRGTRR